MNAMEQHKITKNPDLDEILDLDKKVKQDTEKAIQDKKNQ
jgi:hypothetical protein